MSNQKGSVAVWAIIVLVVIVIAGAVYWYLTQVSAQPAVAPTSELQTQQTANAPSQQGQTTQTEPTTAIPQTNTPTPNSSSSPSATISQSSLTVNSSQPTPTLSGTAAGVSMVKVEIWKPDSAASGGYAWWTGVIVPVSDGSWSASVAQGSDATTLPVGTYKVDILNWDNSGADPTQLAQGTLTVE